MNILISGCSSSIGKKIIPRLSNMGHSVVGLRRGQCADTRYHRCISINLLNGREIERIAEINAELLILLAWETTPKAFWNDPINIDWQRMTLRMVEIFKLSGGKKVLGIGSCAEYTWESDSPLSECDETLPITKYGQAKLETFKGIEAMGIDFIWTRLFFMFGASDPRGKFFADLINACEHNLPFEVSNPESRIDFINVNEVVNSLCSILESRASGVYNVGSGIGYVVGDLAKEFIKQTSSDCKLIISTNQNYQTNVVANIVKLDELIKLPKSQSTDSLVSELLTERSKSV